MIPCKQLFLVLGLIYFCAALAPLNKFNNLRETMRDGIPMMMAEKIAEHALTLPQKPLGEFAWSNCGMLGWVFVLRRQIYLVYLLVECWLYWIGMIVVDVWFEGSILLILLVDVL